MKPPRRVVAQHAGASRLDGIRDFGNGAQPELADLALDIRLGEVETLADDAAFLLLLLVDIDAELRQIDAALPGPVEDRGLERLGAHDRAVDLLVGQALEKLHDVLVGDAEGLNGREAAFLDNGAKRLGGGDGRSAAEGQVARLGDDVPGRVRRVAPDAEGEPEGIAAGDRAVVAEAVRVRDLAHVGSGLAVDRIHEELLGFFAVVPGHA